MGDLNNLREIQLNLILGFIKFNPIVQTGRIYDISPLVNENLTDDDMMEQISHILLDRKIVLEGQKINIVNRYKLIQADEMGIDIEDILNPFLSIEQLKFLIEFKKQGIDVGYVANENLTIEEMSTIVNYVIKSGYDELYDLIRYMSRDTLDKLLTYINNMVDCIQFLAQYKKERAKIIDSINMYQYKYNNHENRGLNHSNIVKVYTQNRYKKNN